MRRYLFALATTLASSASAGAETPPRGKTWQHAELAHVEGDVLVNRGSGYRRAAVGDELRVGDIVMIGSHGGHARISYDQQYIENVRTGHVVVIRRQEPRGLNGYTTTIPAGDLGLFAGGSAVAAGIGVGLYNRQSRGPSP